MKIIIKIFITLFYSGYFKFFPGTFASIISILILFPVVEFELLSLNLFIFSFILIFIISIFFIKKYSFDTNTHDSSTIVIDEFLGIYLIFIFYDLIFVINNILTLLLIFIIFRFFDITKVFPANIIDRNMKNSLGVLLDDLIASIYTIVILYSVNVYIN